MAAPVGRQMSLPVLGSKLVLDTSGQPFADGPADGAVQGLSDLSRRAGDTEVIVQNVAVHLQRAGEVRRHVVAVKERRGYNALQTRFGREIDTDVDHKTLLQQQHHKTPHPKP